MCRKITCVECRFVSKLTGKDWQIIASCYSAAFRFMRNLIRDGIIDSPEQFSMRPVYEGEYGGDRV